VKKSAADQNTPGDFVASSIIWILRPEKDGQRRSGIVVV
jgi:hypothetical protein